jgi:hypothetical protein
MNEELRDQEAIPESLADESTREMLAKARRQTRAYLARKLKVSKETVRRIEKRTDLYISTLRSYVERAGGTLLLIVKFPGKPPVILAGVGGDSGKKRAKKKAENSSKSKAKTGRAA